jgi:tetratricopeptide (TPR) repeat protein
MAGQLPPEQLIEQLCAEQRQRWQGGERVTAAFYLERHPTLADRLDCAVELVYNEVLLREEQGEAPQLDEYLQRFPHLTPQLHRLFAVHQALASQGLLSSQDTSRPTRRLSTLIAQTPAPPLPVVPGYEVLGEVGRGGMGVVYRARHLALNRVVALKMIRAGLHADAEERGRFRAEAEAAARVQHPQLVQIFDVGEADGRPYLALEFVAGGSLAEALHGVPQPPREAARLVEALARAVHAAHQQGVVHRDLKPANILLSGGRQSPEGSSGGLRPPLSSPPLAECTPKITDFGLAKRLEGSAALTRTGEVMGTPAYMAPEQAEGKTRQIGPAADVYALGAMLYEMLTGRPPFLAESPLETLLQVKTLEPVPLRRLQPKVPRDLETICLKCLQKPPERRYASAEELAEDLRRFQAGEPIQARPVGAAERLWRWCRRRPAVAGLAAALLLAVVSGFAGVVWQLGRAETHARREQEQRLRAETNLEAALQAVDAYLDRASEDPRLGSHDLEDLRKGLLQSALPFYQEFVRQRPDDLRLQAVWARAQMRLAYLTAEVDSRARAVDLYQPAREVFAKLAAEHPDVPEYRANLARVLAELGTLYRDTDRRDQREPLYQEALRIREALARDHPNEAKYQSDLADSLMNLSNLYAETGRSREALLLLKQSLEVYGLVKEGQPSAAQRYRQAAIHLNLGLLYRDNGPRDEAERHLLEAERIGDDLAAGHPSVTAYQYLRAESCKHLGRFYNQAPHQQSDRAEAAYLKSRDIQQKLTENHPAVVRYHLALAESWNNLGNFYKVVNKPDEAEKSLGQALAKFQELADNHPGQYQSPLAAAYHNLGAFYLEMNKPEKAEGPLRKGWEIRDRLYREHPAVTEHANHLGSSCVSLGALALRRQKRDEALNWFAEAAGPLEELLQREPNNVRACRLLCDACRQRALILAQQNNAAAALKQWDRAIELSTEKNRVGLQLGRLVTLAQLNEHSQVAGQISAMTNGPAVPGETLYRVASFCALTSEAVRKDARLSPPERGKLVEQYAARAVDLLARACAGGFFHLPANRDRLNNDKNLHPLRSREDFRTLLANIEAEANPWDR